MSARRTQFQAAGQMHKRNTMMITFKRSFLSIALACVCLSNSQSLRAQSGPTFRSRTDGNAERDLQRLREELNKAEDVNGPINPLGAFLQRDAEAMDKGANQDTAVPARLEIGPDERDRRQDIESERIPKLEPSHAKGQLAPALTPKSTTSIGVLPAPRYTIVQQASPQIRVVDGFRPARYVADREATVRPSLQNPVTLASANLPIVGQPTNVISNFQELPFGSNPSNAIPFNAGGAFNAGGLPAAPANILPNNPAILPSVAQPAIPNEALTQPSLPYIPPPSPAFVNPALANPALANPPLGNPAIPNPTFANPNPPLTYSTPIPSGPSSTMVGPPVSYIAPPTYSAAPLSGPAYNTAPPVAPGTNVMPNYARSSSVVNGSPFVSNQPCQFDARYMVSRQAYRQSADPCAPRGSPYAPYATPPGGSPFSYVPPTGMAYNSNGYDSGYRSLIGFGQTLNNAHLGRGIVGQPTAYVEGQPVRNFLRYVFP